MNYARKVALVAGVFYLLTFVSIPTLALYGQVHDPKYVVGPGPDTPVLVGAVLEWIVALSGIGTAVALWPVLRKQNQGLALGFVTSRILEAACIVVGIASLLSIVTLRQSGAGANTLGAAQALVAVYDRMFLFGQSLMPAVNALLLGSLLYQSRLVPRILPTLGLAGAPLLIATQVVILFGLIGRLSPVAAIGALPIALWEFSLGVWLVARGFETSAQDKLLSRTEERNY
ncbi:MAG TPA: DUF4386 domain-containing protein [Bacteroidota bacterium]|nr:DUF4386 domain-containing protein [Bacteroidota bacterium]